MTRSLLINGIGELVTNAPGGRRTRRTRRKPDPAGSP